ncbi:MAG: YmdB family metallophosphoesterase [Spirochaetaceae bacterium]|jgi:metallophosphoesterase (TIGR00282 family)|nr:YmdB family metallophosphoesterase [Spirochaetaceae bacterium]
MAGESAELKPDVDCRENLEEDTRIVLLVGDVIGESGLFALESLLPLIKNEYSVNLTVVNGENAADGFGMSEPSAKRIFAAGADVITSGNHIWEKRDFFPFLESEPRVLRPANYPAGAAGRGFALFEKDAVRWLVINLQGREFMSLTDCPFRVFDAIYEGAKFKENTVQADGAVLPERSDSLSDPLVLVDFHAESTREKEALAFYLDGRAAVVAGTHTHVQTADERILPNGTAYITDLGSSGAKDSIIGMDKTICLERTRTQVAYKMECAKGAGFVQGIAVKINAKTGRAFSVERWTRHLTTDGQ